MPIPEEFVVFPADRKSHQNVGSHRHLHCVVERDFDCDHLAKDGSFGRDRPFVIASAARVIVVTVIAVAFDRG